jgi:hypothetical protein
MILLGIVLVVLRLQVQLATAAGPIANWSQRRFGGSEGRGWQGQFGIGLMLVLVWSPCTGPTLGLASTYAARGDSIGMVALVIFAFGLAAAIPVILLGLLSRAALMRWRDRLRSAPSARSSSILITIGVLIPPGSTASSRRTSIASCLRDCRPDRALLTEPALVDSRPVHCLRQVGMLRGGRRERGGTLNRRRSSTRSALSASRQPRFAGIADPRPRLERLSAARGRQRAAARMDGRQPRREPDPANEH